MTSSESHQAAKRSTSRASSGGWSGLLGCGQLVAQRARSGNRRISSRASRATVRVVGRPLARGLVDA
jgi:hypothetical protein